MAISFSRPDPSSPASVSGAQFSTSRKGYDQAEVRDLLRMVAAEMARLQERERFLERELRAAQNGETVAIDDETATRLLGEEAARILQTAREAATQIRARAEDGSARLLREATDEAQRLREEAEIEAARRRQDASADAEAEVQMAKQQGRDMVNEARSYRERVLSELARRRELARQQIEQLIHGRDRLLQAFERARIAAVDVMAELTPLGEPSEYVNLQPTTGPVPMMVPNLPQPISLDSYTPDEQPATMAMPVVPVIHEATEPPVMYDVAAEPDDDDGNTPDMQVTEDEPDAAIADTDDTDDTVVALPEPTATAEPADDDDREPAPVVALFSDEAASSAGDDKPADTVDDLFAKLRAARTDAVAQRAARMPVVDDGNAARADFGDDTDDTDDATTTDTAPEIAAETPEAAPEADAADGAEPTGGGGSSIADVDELVVPLIVSASRKLKRVLADEQNDVLDTLRRKEPVRSIDALLPWEAEQADRYAAAVESDLIAAAKAGAQGGEDGAAPAIVRPAYDAVTNEIVAPLRERLARCIDKADGKNSELATQVRSLYREWKTHRIDEHVEDIVRLAYDRGALTIASR